MSRDESYAARKEYIKQWANARRRKSIAADICPQCHKRPPATTQLCIECANKKRIRDNEYNAIRVQAASNSGLCRRCFAPLHEDADGDNGYCINCRGNLFGVKWR